MSAALVYLLIGACVGVHAGRLGWHSLPPEERDAHAGVFWLHYAVGAAIVWPLALWSLLTTGTDE